MPKQKHGGRVAANLQKALFDALPPPGSEDSWTINDYVINGAVKTNKDKYYVAFVTEPRYDPFKFLAATNNKTAFSCCLLATTAGGTKAVALRIGSEVVLNCNSASLTFIALSTSDNQRTGEVRFEKPSVVGVDPRGKLVAVSVQQVDIGKSGGAPNLSEAVEREYLNQYAAAFYHNTDVSTAVLSQCTLQPPTDCQKPSSLSSEGKKTKGKGSDPSRRRRKPKPSKRPAESKLARKEKTPRSSAAKQPSVEQPSVKMDVQQALSDFFASHPRPHEVQVPNVQELQNIACRICFWNKKDLVFETKFSSDCEHIMSSLHFSVHGNPAILSAIRMFCRAVFVRAHENNEEITETTFSAEVEDTHQILEGLLSR